MGLFGVKRCKSPYNSELQKCVYTIEVFGDLQVSKICITFAPQL